MTSLEGWDSAIELRPRNSQRLPACPAGGSLIATTPGNTGFLVLVLGVSPLERVHPGRFEPSRTVVSYGSEKVGPAARATPVVEARVDLDSGPISVPSAVHRNRLGGSGENRRQRGRGRVNYAMTCKVKACVTSCFVLPLPKVAVMMMWYVPTVLLFFGFAIPEIVAEPIPL